jgi:hypothetical protein
VENRSLRWMTSSPWFGGLIYGVTIGALAAVLMGWWYGIVWLVGALAMYVAWHRYPIARVRPDLVGLSAGRRVALIASIGLAGAVALVVVTLLMVN